MKIADTNFKYFKKIEHTVSESAQACGPNQVGENEVQRQLQSMSEPQPKKKKQRYGSFDKIQRGRNCEIGCCPWGKTCNKEIWHS